MELLLIILLPLLGAILPPLAERLGAPVANGYLRNDSFPASHPLWAGPLGYQGSKAAMKLIAKEGRDAFYQGEIAEDIISTAGQLGIGYYRMNWLS